MRKVALCSILFATGVLAAQQTSTSLPIRSISVKLVPTSNADMNAIPFDSIMAAWRNERIDLAVEHGFDAAAVDKASDAIRTMYAGLGHKVRVEHKVTQVSPRSLDVAFEVIQLCPCR
jgi:hypothetical protein